jgi:hypothetical protein
MRNMKVFLDKKKYNNLFTPDFFLSLILLAVAIRFASEVPTWFDIPQSDDNEYMSGGIHFSEMLNGAQSNWTSDWSPLYQFWFFVIYRFVPDATKIYYISMRLVGVLIPFFAFILLRRMQVTRWLALATAAFFLASYAVWMVEPRVTSFAALVLLFLWWATSFLKERWQRFFGMAAGSLFFAYSRPEFFLITLMLGLIALTYLGFSLLKRGRKLGRADFLFLGLSSGITILFLVWWGVPFSGERSIYAFGQHYARNVDNCLTEGVSDNMPWEEILARDFENAQSIQESIQANPLNFRRHLTCNIQAFPKLFLKVAFTSSWGNSWLFIRVWIAFLLFRLTVSWNEIMHRLIWLWEKDYLLLGLLSLGILLLDIILIYPREHYLALFSIILWILGISLFGGSPAPEQRNWRQSIAIGLCLLLLTPSMGVLFDFKVPQKPVLKTVETLRALDLDEPLRVFATRPFRSSRSEIYFDETYYHIPYKPAEISFGEYISAHQPNVIVITQGGLELKDDPSWIAFEVNPQGFGFHQIPFDEGDQWGLWRFYLME